MTATLSSSESCDISHEILKILKPSVPFGFSSEKPHFSNVYRKYSSYRTDPLDPETTKTEAICILRQLTSYIITENLIQAALELGNKTFKVDGDKFQTTEEPLLLSEAKLPEGDFTHFVSGWLLDLVPGLKSAYSGNTIRFKKVGPNQFERLYPYITVEGLPDVNPEYAKAEYVLSFLWNEGEIFIVGEPPESIVGKWTKNSDRTFKADFDFQIALRTPNNITAIIHKIENEYRRSSTSRPPQTL